MASQAAAVLGRKRWEGTTKEERSAHGLAMSAAKQRGKTKEQISALARLSQSRGFLTSFEPPERCKPSGCNVEILRTAE